jgi:hypothetical protein
MGRRKRDSLCQYYLLCIEEEISHYSPKSNDNIPGTRTIKSEPMLLLLLYNYPNL